MSHPAVRKDFYDTFGVLSAIFGCVPSLFQVQSNLPEAVEAEARIIASVLADDHGLDRSQKSALLQAVTLSRKNAYCLALCNKQPGGRSAPQDSMLAAFAVTLAHGRPSFSASHVEVLRRGGFEDAQILDAVLTTALAQWLCTLANGLSPELDSGFSPPALDEAQEPFPCSELAEPVGPYLRSLPKLADDFSPFTFLRDQYGFVPNLFRAQTLRPVVLEAEARAIELIVLGEELLSRIQKERMLLALSAANLNTYSVALHCEVLSILGTSCEDSDQIVTEHHSANIPEADKALLDGGRMLGLYADEGSRFDPGPLLAHGFTQAQILEAIAVCGLGNFLNTLQTGLGVVPDFKPKHVFTARKLYPEAPQGRPIADSDVAQPHRTDPDAELVLRVQAGDSDAFEELARRHTRRIFATLAGMLCNREEARDAMQDVFLKAFRHIASFQGRSKFSTWLTSIAVNTGTEVLRRRTGTEFLVEDDEGFRPRQVQSWAEDPEKLCAAAQVRDLVMRAVQQLPYKYRVAVILRDINQLSTEEAAAALELKVPALKARLMRGRLMLREALAPHFTKLGKS